MKKQGTKSMAVCVQDEARKPVLALESRSNEAITDIAGALRQNASWIRNRFTIVRWE